jgi:hypothetical protein
VSTLLVIFDPTDQLRTDVPNRLGIKVARMPVADDLESQDIYAVARRVAELLLEQLR